MNVIDAVGGKPFRLRNPLNPRHLLPDLALLFRRNRDGQYVLNNRQNRVAALRSCYLKATDHVEMVAHYADGSLMALSRGSNIKTTVGIDYQTKMTSGDAFNGTSGTSTTAPTATTYTLDGVSAPGVVNFYAGHIIYTLGVKATVLSSTNAAPPVLTLARWETPATPGGSVASTPVAGTYIISEGVAPAQWIGITTDSATPLVGDTTLASESNANGVVRSFATFAHTAGTSTATLSKVFTASGNVGVLQKVGAFNAQNNGTLYAESLLNATANLAVSGDSASLVWTFTHA